MELKVLILLIFLVAASIWDLKERCIPVWVFSLTGIVIVFLELVFILNEMSGIMEEAEYAAVAVKQVMVTANGILTVKLGGMAVGFALLVISKLTQGQIGEGDGITFLITGFSLGFGDNFLLLLEALLLSFAWSLVLMFMKKINLKTSLPFLPFVLTAFIIRMVPQMFF